MAENKKPWWRSSADAEKLSRTVVGFFSLGVLSAVVAGLGLLGVQLEVNDLNDITKGVGEAIVAIGALGSSLYGLYGAVAKVVNYFKKPEA